MANEFKIKHGFISTGNGTVEGELRITGASYADNGSRIATRPWVTQYLSDNSYATAGDITTAISNLVDSAPGTLDTLNELAAAIGDDPNFATSISTSIAAKLPLAGGTMTGNITFTDDAEGIIWSRNTDGASIKFYNTADGDTDSRLEFHTNDNNNEYFRWTHGPSGGALYEVMKLMPTSSGSSRLTVQGDIYAGSNKIATETHVSSNYLSKFHDMTITLTGDASGTGTFTNMGDVSFAVTVANDSHTHDGRYYTETEVDTLLGTKAAKVHTHDAADIVSGTFPSERLSGTYTINVSGTSTYANNLYRDDNRTIAPSEDTNGTLSFGFTSFQNDNTGPWADYLHLRSYTDSSGGRDNLLMFSKADMEIRLWQQDFNSADNYADFRDIAFKDELQVPAIKSNGSTPSLNTGITAGEIRTLIGAGTSSFDGAYSSLSGIPTSFTPSAHNQAWSTITGTPTTLSGYGITDAASSTHTHGRIYSESGTTTNYLALSSSNELELFNSSGVIQNLYLNYSGGANSLLGPGGGTIYHSGNLTIGTLDGYTQGEVDNLVDAKADLSHTHTFASLTSKPAFVNNSLLSSRATETPDTVGDSYGANVHYMADGATNSPSGVDHALFTMSYSNAWQTQLAQDWRENGRIYIRGQENGTWSGWGQVWSSHDFTSTNISNWNTAYGWGDHASAGYASAGYLTNTGGAKIEVQNAVDGGTNNGIYMWQTSDPNWVIYMATSADGTAADGGVAPAGIDGATEHAIRFRVNDNSGQAGFIWENSSNVALMQMNGGSGHLYVNGKIFPSNQTTDYVDATRIQKWQTAYGWGDHAAAGYITDGNTGWNNTYGFITASDSITGNAATATKLATARNIALSGAVTGNANFDGSGNITIATTATSDPTLTLAGDATGSATFTNLGNATLTVAVVNDSHTHDGRYYTESESDARFVNVTGDTITGDLTVSGATLGVISNTEGTEAFYVDGVNGRLFTISDDLSDSLFSVNTISGLPVIEAFADNTVKMGPFSNPVTIDSSGVLAIGGVTAATQTYVDNAISGLIGGAPGALDTLNELAAAINDDASYASTVTTALGTKAPLASPALTGTPTAPTAATATNSTQIATTAFVKAQGYVTTDTNYYLNGITRAGNVLTFSVAGATNQTYTFGSAAWAATTAFDAAGAADAVDQRIDNEVLPLISTPAITSNGSTPALNTGITAAEVRTLIGAGTSSSDTNYYLDGLSFDTGNGVLTASVAGATNQTVDLDGRYALSSHSHSYLPLSGGTVTGTLTLTGSTNASRLRIEGTTPTIDLDDSDGDSFYIHVNSNNFYVLVDRDGTGDYNTWEGPHPLQLEGDTNTAYIFGNKINSAAYAATSAFDAAGSAATAESNAIAHADTRIEEEVLPSIPTNNNQLTNGAGYITDGNTNWNNTYGFITASSTDTLTNKSGNISQWTNDSGYLTGINSPTSGDWWNNGFVKVGTDGVMEVGKYIDFHDTDTQTSDFSYRITNTGGRLYFGGDIEIDGGDIYINDGNTRLHEAGGNALKVSTNSGYIELGPQNTSHCHIQTDRSNFYFNTELRVNGGIIGSYDEDLSIRRAGTTKLYVATTDSTFYTNVLPDRDRTLTLGNEELRWQIVFCEILDSAGQHEKNLQNPEGEKSVAEYSTGTVLVWKGGKNIPCTEYADHMRMGIAVEGIDSPLIQGAEPVLVTGPVKEGDYLVTSRKEGHAEAISPELMRQQGLYDCVFGKALETADGESHLVKVWINI